ncbi:unnamed protein product [Brassica rapa]|uniref:Uncharacterized protein n=1 Tax=Brassica campestris TaxID=3711 RepID=A0A3P6A343_BRACM|nr:unnamed protein product [Brassica rapa]VDC84089.1 unnamed protein product [Brassica rapa]
MLGSSEWSSGCESGWTLYLDHSVSSFPSSSCFRDINGFENRRRSKDSWSQNYVHQEEDEEEDLSMMSDASSGPRNVCEEDSVKKLNSVGPKKQNKSEKKRRDYEKMNSVLDDTASSHMLQKSVGGNKIEQTFPESTLDYSQGFSATHIQVTPSLFSALTRSRSPLSFFISTPKTLIISRTPDPPCTSLFASRRPRDFINGRRDGFVDGDRSWNRKIRPEYGIDEDYEEDEDEEEEEEEEEDRSLDLLLRFVENVFRKVSKRARKAVRSVLPVSISTKLVGFSVNGVLILAFLWILKAFLEVACTLGTIVFTSILFIRGLWAGVAYVQESRNNRINELADDPRAWNGVQPAS